MSYKFIIGVEGGGSTCRVILGKAGGTVIDRRYVHKGASVAAPNLAETCATLKDAIDDTIAAHNLDRDDVHIALCLPGVSHAGRLALLKDELGRYYGRTIPITSDAMAALLNVRGGLADNTGILIAGTGSILLGYNNGTLYRLGGKGYPNDAYSGAGLSRECLAAYMRGIKSGNLNDCLNRRALPLAAAFDDFIAGNGLAGAEDIGRLPPRAMATLFPAILDHVTKTPRSLPFIGKIFARHLDRCIADVSRFYRETGITRLGLTGSVAQRLLPLIAHRLPAALTITQQKDAIEGAFCFSLATADNPRFLENMPERTLDSAPPGTSPAAPEPS